MKRILAVFLLLLTVALLFSCKKNSNKEEKFDLVSSADPIFDYYHSDLSPYVTVSREDYVGLTVSLDITDKEVDDYLRDQLLPSYRTPLMATGRTVKADDTVYIYYTGYIDGVPFENGSNAEDEIPAGLVVGAGRFTEDFERQLIGVVPANTSKEKPLSISVTFPENYSLNPDLSGKTARFDVVIVGIYDGGYKVPELTADFVTNTVKFEAEGEDVVAEFRLALKNQMRENAVKSLNTRKISCMIDQLCSVLRIEKTLPEGEVDRIVSDMEESLTSFYQQYNFNYYMSYGKVYFDSLDDAARAYYELRYDADWRAYQTSYASRSVRQLLALNAIAQLEGVRITESDAKAWVLEKVKQLQDNGEEATPQTVLEQYSIEEVYAQTAVQRARDILLETVVFDYGELPIPEN